MGVILNSARLVKSAGLSENVEIIIDFKVPG